MNYTIPIKIGEECVGSFKADSSIFDKFANKLIEFNLAYVKEKSTNVVPQYFSVEVSSPTWEEYTEEEYTDEEKLKIRHNIIKGKPSVADIYIKRAKVKEVILDCCGGDEDGDLEGLAPSDIFKRLGL